MKTKDILAGLQTRINELKIERDIIYANISDLETKQEDIESDMSDIQEAYNLLDSLNNPVD